MELQALWQRALEHIRAEGDISDVAFNVWLDAIEPVAMDDGDVVLVVHTNFQKKIVLEHYFDRLRDALCAVSGVPLDVRLVSREEDGNAPASMQDNPFADGDSEQVYTFDNFVVGPSNKFAHAAAQAVAGKPGGGYNPLFIYGGSGLGKTHLLYAICNEIKQRYPDMNVVYTKGETLTNELIEAIRQQQTPDFRLKYRQADVLLVDDVQFIAGKPSTQEEFFHTFDALHQANRQIVLTSDRPPREMATLEDRLRTRFEMGLLADIQIPDLETRVAIVQKKAGNLNLPLSDDVYLFIAEQLKSNVRQLEGTVKRIRAMCFLTGASPNLITAQLAIRDIRADASPAPVTVEKIVQEVARTLNVAPDDIRSSKQSGPVSAARQLAVYAVRQCTSLSMQAIGEEFGGRDHSTMVYAIDKVAKRMEKEVSYKNLVNDLIKNLKEY
ncbi:MAG: chromosomal replication initiator protein DnaA [Oscillospiraceae bacterium]|nr:chromosomal replication initiator protein DnaA [Oscillospiraceae bacterium]